MKLAALFSGGKDSTFAIFKAGLDGHAIQCLVTIFPKSEESLLLHHPNLRMTEMQALLMGKPQIEATVDSLEPSSEVAALRKALLFAKERFGVEGILHGGIKSVFQKRNFEEACADLGLGVVAPLWGIEEKEYLRLIVRSGFRFIITSVSSGGLDKSWLGKLITAGDVEDLIKLAARHGINPSFEGGEAETFVIGCPLFSGSIKILAHTTSWDGYRGRFEITEAALEERC
ncbi:MAG: diphthine--ammonia ligase [Thaumarchaeota archaeon]|nr:diphthine--ammonia ligase [Nitrososphaerota archaeon]